MIALRKTKTDRQNSLHKKGSLQIPVVDSPQIVALMGASTQRYDGP